MVVLSVRHLRLLLEQIEALDGPNVPIHIYSDGFNTHKLDAVRRTNGDKGVIFRPAHSVDRVDEIKKGRAK